MQFLFRSILPVLLALASLSAAWPWPEFLNKAGLMVHEFPRLNERAHGMFARAETTGSAAATTGGSATSTTAKETSTATDSTSKTDSASNTGTATGTGASKTDTSTGTDKGTKTTDASTSSISVDPRAGAGGISMITPAVTETTYFKIGEYVTLKWNYTSLSVTPSRIDVVASCSANNHMYTLTSNATVDPTGAVTWDTGNYQSTATIPLLTETYTLLVYDAATEPSAQASAGHLGTSNTFTFGMYAPQKYTPLNEFQCATCSAAFSDMERQVMSFVVGMVTLTVLSFTLFAGGLGAL